MYTLLIALSLGTENFHVESYAFDSEAAKSSALRVNAGLMEVRHCLKALFPELLTWKCIRYGAPHITAYAKFFLIKLLYLLASIRHHLLLIDLAVFLMKVNKKSPTNLLAMAVGKKQKGNVNEIVKKFPSTDFVVMLFHYDGVVDDWRDLEWSSRAIHVSAVNQTKWWFAKRFLHPDVISEYAYIFLWDEDLGVENFHAGRYLSIVKEEGLHISQPALDPHKSEVHHQITSRKEGVKLHRRITGLSRSGKRCFENSTDPPCTGILQMGGNDGSCFLMGIMALRMNDWIYAWGLDMQLGYCAQGNRTQNIGIIDSEYVVHSGLPTLGGSAENKVFLESGWINLILRSIDFHLFVSMPASINASPVIMAHSTIKIIEENWFVYALEKNRLQISIQDASEAWSWVRKQSLVELERFKRKWRKAVSEDKSWIDPYEQPVKRNS
ncbi:hypothetical protein RJ640_025316 [Escallonia rubra]|uniref:Uncharacterized protein n=1 Tax=Escallonia rubra TaxID=112253 RepID=A0AA88U8I5_9ASTE|nr:hypothetical protein RJ640_025316 [Escallonia rubra]